MTLLPRTSIEKVYGEFAGVHELSGALLLQLPEVVAPLVGMDTRSKLIVCPASAPAPRTVWKSTNVGGGKLGRSLIWSVADAAVENRFDEPDTPIWCVVPATHVLPPPQLMQFGTAVIPATVP